MQCPRTSTTLATVLIIAGNCSAQIQNMARNENEVENGTMRVLLDAGPLGARELIFSHECTNERAFNVLQSTATELVTPERR